MIKVLFICHGNICRSPMAEFIFKDLVNKEHMSDKFLINSAATSREEIYGNRGNPIYPPAQRELKKNGVLFDDHRAVQVTADDYENYDLLICMDRNNIRNLKRIIGDDIDNKCHLLMEYAGLDEDVPDPWYTNDFEGVFKMIFKGCSALLEKCK